MKRKMSFIIFSLALILSACDMKEEPTISSSATPQVSDKISHSTSPTQETKVSENPKASEKPKVSEKPKASESPVSEESNDNQNEYTGYGKWGFNVANEIPLEEQDEYYKIFGTMYDSYKLYKYEDNDNKPIEEVAIELRKVLMEDMKTDYEGKQFIVTEYKDLSANIRREHITGDFVLKDNQWLCQFKAKYKYMGDFGVLGAMPEDIEWMESFGCDGSGEDHYFIIEKTSDTEYIMRGFTSCAKYVVEETDNKPNDNNQDISVPSNEKLAIAKSGKPYIYDVVSEVPLEQQNDLELIESGI